MAAKKTQLAFSHIKGSIPLSMSDDNQKMDQCTRDAIALVKDTRRHVGNAETYLTAGQNGAMDTVLSAYWDTNMSVETAQQGIINALRR